MLVRGKRMELTLILVVIFGLAVCAGGCTDKSGSENQSDLDAAPESYKFTCPFDGVSLEALPKGAPLAVIIDNHPRARPQSGLANADMVVETLAEGGVTRFLAIYYHGEASRVGPVRSARSYFIDLAMSVNAVLVHAGGSPDALSYMRSNSFPHLNEFNYGKHFSRDRQRSAPHNLYTSTENLQNLVRQEGWDHPEQMAGFHFKKDQEASELFATEAQAADVLISNEIEIGFPRQYDVSYTYDPENKAYSRFIAGEPHTDELTGSQIQPRNIIVKFVKTRVIDGQGRLQIDVVGHGRALVFTEGKVIEAVWTNKDRNQPSVFETVEGQVIELLPGQVWVEMVPESTKVTF